jgi:hypothetical protein
MATRQKKAVIRSYKLGQRRCYCGTQLVYQPNQKNSATFEHLVPKSAGGTYHQFNCLIVCRRCNQARGNQCWITWIEKHSPPKKEWLIEKYMEAIRRYRGNREICVSNAVKNRAYGELS